MKKSTAKLTAAEAAKYAEAGEAIAATMNAPELPNMDSVPEATAAPEAKPETASINTCASAAAKPAAEIAPPVEWTGSAAAWDVLYKTLSKADRSRPVLGCAWVDGRTVTTSTGKRLVTVTLKKQIAANGAYKMDNKKHTLTLEPGLTVPMGWHGAIPAAKNLKNTVDVDFHLPHPLYPELYRLMSAMNAAGGYAMADEDMDAVIDTFGAYTCHWQENEPILFVGSYERGEEIVICAMRTKEPHQMSGEAK